ncbi:MAG: hypothetical protein G01um101433_510 [Parcubacteria group bacterium Gr01-1014_33]|nr:MAG: hypothetical protein G01um101433_510 [Parcubacteria group bacterium Gr01-1014_33]
MTTEIRIKGSKDYENDRLRITTSLDPELKGAMIKIENAEIEVRLPMGVYFKAAPCKEYSGSSYLDCLEKGEIVFRLRMEWPYLKALFHTLKEAFPDED